MIVLIISGGAMESKNDDKLELDFTKTVKKKPQARKSYNITKPVNPQVSDFYKENNRISEEEQRRMLRKSREMQRNSLMLRLFVSFLIISGYYFFIYKYMQRHGGDLMIKATIGLFIYTVISYFIRPKPDMNNLGYFGGLINRPFDHTDDWNRFLLNMKILLLPGVIISEAIVDLFSRD